MKKLTLHIVFLFLSLGSLQMLLSQGTTLNSNGRINNSGTIRIKAGQVKLNQDTIHGIRFQTIYTSHFYLLLSLFVSLS